MLLFVIWSVIHCCVLCRPVRVVGRLRHLAAAKGRMAGLPGRRAKGRDPNTSWTKRMMTTRKTIGLGNQGCRSGPCSAGSVSSKSELEKPDPDPTDTRQESIQAFNFFSHQSDFFRYLYVDFFCLKK